MIGWIKRLFRGAPPPPATPPEPVIERVYIREERDPKSAFTFFIGGPADGLEMEIPKGTHPHTLAVRGPWEPHWGQAYRLEITQNESLDGQAQYAPYDGPKNQDHMIPSTTRKEPVDTLYPDSPLGWTDITRPAEKLYTDPHLYRFRRVGDGMTYVWAGKQ